MYLEFFKFKKNPFHITPDPDFLFMSESHQEAAAALIYGIEERKGFIAITGEVGVGKTTILRSYLEGTDPEKVKVIYIFNSALPFRNLLKQILTELGIPVENEEPAEMIFSLFHYVIEEYRNDRNLVLIIDEAQNMPVETLENLRMLSNLETSKEKLLQIVMVGQPEFEVKLEKPELRQLRQRIAIRCRIDALSPEESMAYIQHRLMKASSFHNAVFTKGALKAIVKEANGIPRTINVLCDNALITAFGDQRNPVNSGIVKEVIADMRGARRGFARVLRASLFAVPVILTALVIFLFYGQLARQEGPLHTAVAPDKVEAVGKAEPARVPDADHQMIVKKLPQQDDPAGAVTEQQVPAASVSNEIASKREATTAQSRPLALSQDAPLIHEPVTAPETREPVTAPEVGQPVNTLEVREHVTAPEVRQPVKTQEVRDPITAPETKTAATRVVKRGEFLYPILLEFYGRVDAEVVDAFRKVNPRITNIDKIMAGEEVVLPRLEKIGKLSSSPNEPNPKKSGNTP